MPLVTTIPERCRVCYTCVRECPARAIRIVRSQAEVMPERCIGCGNCVRVCSQQAKQLLSSLDSVQLLLSGPEPVAVLVAPSYPAEFPDVAPGELVGMLRRLGFTGVHEVGFGADLVARAYTRLLAERPTGRFIATTCPAVTSYVERLHPELVPLLAPIVSPMVATARVLRRHGGAGQRTVFVGPCLAKKEEAIADQVKGEIDCVLTFAELRQLFAECHVAAERGDAEAEDFDPPHAGAGALFPITRGMLEAAGIPDDLLRAEVVAAAGRVEFRDALREFESGGLEARLLEVLCCTGCVMGPGMTTEAPLFARRSRVSRQVRTDLARRERAEYEAAMRAYDEVDLARGFAADDQRLPGPSPAELSALMARLGKLTPQDELNCGACGYDTCREHAVAIHEGLAESEMCLPYTIEELRRAVQELAVSHGKLANAQEALVHSEKLASMGQLAAGIAHEVNNPLGVVLMYTHMLLEETPASSPLRDDLATIVEQTDRAKRIVSGLLNFARQNEVVLRTVDVRELVERCLRAAAVPEEIEVRTEHRGEALAELDGDQISQVLINLITNACAAMAGGGRLRVTTEGLEDRVRFEVADSGIGIPAENRGRIFTPFFTTKPAGKGTGLGLAVTYGIVKMHRGEIRVESNADPMAGPTGTTFTVTLPARRPEGAEGAHVERVAGGPQPGSLLAGA
ncbi:MAG: 4Fe-4S binding protein [Thermoanaerobaculia bacterium]|nr:4Fe-4S binding protein [Thermoanaerobaculia bacterium]